MTDLLDHAQLEDLFSYKKVNKWVPQIGGCYSKTWWNNSTYKVHVYQNNHKARHLVAARLSRNCQLKNAHDHWAQVYTRVESGLHHQAAFPVPADLP